MTSPFVLTARSIARDVPRRSLAVLLASMLLLAAWGAWFSLSRVPVYETSKSARIELLRASHPVDAPIAGRVIEVRLRLGDTVNDGDVLAKLDASSEELALAEARAKIGGIAPQLSAIRDEVKATERAIASYQRQLDAQLAETKERVHESQIVTRAGRDEAERFRRMLEAKVASEADFERAKNEADRRAADESAVRTTLEKQRREWATGSDDRKSKLATLAREAAQLEAVKKTLEAQIPSLENAIARRTIRATASGRIGELGQVRVGSVLSPGDHIATIVGSGDLRVVAELDPAAAFGHVRPGQHARVRLDGFPWTEYGALEATVTDVATEIRDGQARVELTIDDRAGSRIPLQHGLPGAVDIAIDEATPLTLILRAAGKPRS